MSNTFNNNPNIPDFSPFIEMVKAVRETMKPITEVVRKFDEIMQPIREFSKSVQLQLKEVAVAVSESLRPLRAAEMLGEAQYVYWNFMTNEFVDVIINSQNINETLGELIERDNFKAVDDTIEKCRTNPYMGNYTYLFDQSVAAFLNGQLDLAVTGFTSIIDGLLSDTSGNQTTRIATRANAIIEKLEENETVDSDEYALMILLFTFEKTMELFSASSDFKGEEPKELNRHWIMHGRSRRRKTKLDCVKLVNFIYGILLIDEFGKKR